MWQKILKISVCMLTILAIGIIVYYNIKYEPDPYHYETAIKNGDVVVGPMGTYNVDKLYNFIKNVENKKKDKLRITGYTHEGDPIISDLEYDGKIIKCSTDRTKDKYGSKTKNYGEYTKIIKKKNNIYTEYILIDETGRYEDNFIFQE